MGGNDRINKIIWHKINKKRLGWLTRKNTTLRFSSIIQCFLLKHSKTLFLHCPPARPPSPVREFLQCPLNIHTVSHTGHSQVQEVILGE